MKKKRLIIFLGVWLAVQVMLIWMVAGSKGKDNSPNVVALVTAIGAPLGPFAGGIARYSQESCMRFSIQILPWFLPFLIVTGTTLLVRNSHKKVLRIVALLAWGVGWCGWMLGAIASVGFAIG